MGGGSASFTQRAMPSSQERIQSSVHRSREWSKKHLNAAEEKDPVTHEEALQYIERTTNPLM